MLYLLNKRLASSPLVIISEESPPPPSSPHPQLETARYQLLKYALRIILPTYAPQKLNILISIRRNSVLARMRIIHIAERFILPHGLCVRINTSDVSLCGGIKSAFVRVVEVLASEICPLDAFRIAGLRRIYKDKSQTYRSSPHLRDRVQERSRLLLYFCWL